MQSLTDRVLAALRAEIEKRGLTYSPSGRDAKGLVLAIVSNGEHWVQTGVSEESAAWAEAEETGLAPVVEAEINDAVKRLERYRLRPH